jgi:Flp pilus assembly pilin Flp
MPRTDRSWTAAASIMERKQMSSRITRQRRLSIDRGASAVEYGLLVAAIAAVIVAVVFGLGNIVAATFQQTEDCIVAIENGPNCNPDPGP